MKASRIFLIPIVGLLLGSCIKNQDVNLTPSQFTTDTTAISAYLQKNNIAATEFPSGVWFIIDSAAEGIRPTFKDSIMLKYTARRLEDNSILDQRTTPKHFVLDSLLSAIQVVLREFQAGSKGRIFLPSYYTSNGNWIFQFQLTDVKDHQLKIDNAIIDSYLSTQAINAVRDPSGLRFTVDTLKTGSKVFMSDEVQVNYTAKNLTSGSTIDSGNSVSLFVSSPTLILGWRIALQKMPEGSTFTFYIPSSLAYGPEGNGVSIQSNTNLIFTIKLLKVIHH